MSVVVSVGTVMSLLDMTIINVGSALYGVAWSTGSLSVFRVLHGFGGGMIMPPGRWSSRAPPVRSGWAA